MTAESLKKKLCSSPNGNRTNREIWRRQTVAALATRREEQNFVSVSKRVHIK